MRRAPGRRPDSARLDRRRRDAAKPSLKNCRGSRSELFPLGSAASARIQRARRNPSTLAHRDTLRTRCASPARGEGWPLRTTRGPRPSCHALSAPRLVLLRNRRPTQACGTRMGALCCTLVGEYHMRKRGRTPFRRSSRHPRTVDCDSKRCRQAPVAAAVVRGARAGTEGPWRRARRYACSCGSAPSSSQRRRRALTSMEPTASARAERTPDRRRSRSRDGQTHARAPRGRNARRRRRSPTIPLGRRRLRGTLTVGSRCLPGRDGSDGASPSGRCHASRRHGCNPRTTLSCARQRPERPCLHP